MVINGPFKGSSFGRKGGEKSPPKFPLKTMKYGDWFEVCFKAESLDEARKKIVSWRNEISLASKYLGMYCTYQLIESVAGEFRFVVKRES